MMKQHSSSLLLICLAAETFLGTYGLILGEQTAVVSVLYLLAGLAISISILFFPVARLNHTETGRKDFFLKVILFAVMMLLAYITARYWLEEIPLDPDFADMLPIIKVMNERFLRGHFNQVYAPVAEIWHGTTPIYLPAMWLPYTPAVKWNFDMRWITVICLLGSFALLLRNIQIRNWLGWTQLLILAVLFWWIFARNDVHGLVSMSEEGVVILYFSLLTCAIISQNAILMGLATACCLLSRYSMVGWVLPCVIYFVSQREYRKLFVFVGICGSAFLIFFLIPFGIIPFRQMLELPAQYISFGKKIWENSPDVYWQNLGMAKFYGERKLALLHRTLLVASFTLPVLFMCFCIFQKRWKFQNINLACFKVSVLVFYQFVDVPYGYLFYTGSFISLFIGASLLRRDVRLRGFADTLPASQ